MGWTTFGKVADVIGVVVSGIGTGMTAKDIIENILDPSAGLNDAVAELSAEIAELGRKIDDLAEQQRIEALNDGLQLSKQAFDRVKDYPELGPSEIQSVIRDAFNGLDDVVNTATGIMDRDPTPEEVLSVGSAVSFAMLVQIQSAALFSEGEYLGPDASTQGGERQHGGHRRDSIRDNLIEGVQILQALDEAAEQALDLDVSQSTTTYYATDTTLDYNEWWTRADDGALIDFLEFAGNFSFGGGGSTYRVPSKTITTYTINVDGDADGAKIKAVLETFFGDDYQLHGSTPGAPMTAWVPTGTTVTIPAEATGGAPLTLTSGSHTAHTISNYLEDAITHAIYGGTPLDGTGETSAELIAPVIDLIDGQMIRKHDGDGTFHGTRSSTDQRGESDNPFLSADGDDFITNVGSYDGATLLGYGGSDYLKGGINTDIMKGGSGNDVYFGGTGNDTLFDDEGGLDRAIFVGDKQDYTLTLEVVDDALSVVVSGQETIVDGQTVYALDGRDSLYGIESVTFDDVTVDLRTEDFGTDKIADGVATWTLAEGSTNLFGWIGDNDLTGRATDDRLVGQDGQDTLSGQGGDDDLAGNGGDDVLRGDGGNDLLLGGAGADTLEGGQGNDTLNGGDGVDWLEGGDGADVFVFDNMDDVDVITDFQSGTDKIQLDGDVFFGFDGGFGTDDLVFGMDVNPSYYAMAPWMWGMMGAFDNSMVYRDGALFYDDNGGMYGGETLIAFLEGAPTLAASDFEII
ncbi:calcium-binding protein [Palleronia pelagia]|uniref:Hemolysin-type calcium-binding repeat-containing protein n=1 Tax=Palleronia pelagia TaxID=387096 RepID=A0A1H8DK06_9RHOB|nr:calcium-binding protein [Palleronia pelagia]SEN07619.1 Hemolysin-type calcium-binding repeat-containing protein [Palleronia pelagia]